MSVRERRRRRRPGKIASLIGTPEGAFVRDLVSTARDLNTPPTLYAGIRLMTTTTVYDDPERDAYGRVLREARVVETISSPLWTPEDRALLFALATWEQSLCTGCGQPRERAWHSETEGFWQTEAVVCQACTQLAGGEKRAGGGRVIDGYPYGTKGPLPPFVWGQTTEPMPDTDEPSAPAPAPREESL